MMYYVIVLKNEQGQFFGKIIKDFEERTTYYCDEPQRVIEKVKKFEFCLIDKNFHTKIEEGQIWQCEVIKTFIDRRNKEVKIMKPVNFIHYHGGSAHDFENGIYKIRSGYWVRVEKLKIEINEEEFKDEFIHYIDKHITTILECPFCEERKIWKKKKREILYQAPVEDIMKFWLEYLGPEFFEVAEKRRQLEMKIYELKKKFEKKKEEIYSKIEELKYQGKVRRKLTENERKAYIESVWNYWERSGGDPFDEPSEAPEYIWEIVDPQAVEKAQKKIEQLKKLLEIEEKELEEKIRKMRFDSIDEKVERVSQKAAELIERRLYPCIIEKIYQFDPYFFEFTRLEWMHPIEAVEYVFMVCGVERK